MTYKLIKGVKDEKTFGNHCSNSMD